MNTLQLKQKLIIVGVLVVIIIFALGAFIAELSRTNTSSNTPVNSIPTQSQINVTQGTNENVTQTQNTISQTPLKLITINPADGTSNIPRYTTFTGTFNRLINQNEVSVAFSPTTSFTTRIDTSILYIDAPSLRDNTSYTITLSYSTDGKQSFHFRTAPTDSSIYQDHVGQSVDAWTKENRPDISVYNNLPYSATDFSIQAYSKPGHYSFTVSLTGSDRNTAQQDFLSWLKTTVGLTDQEISKLDLQYQ